MNHTTYFSNIKRKKSSVSCRHKGFQKVKKLVHTYPELIGENLKIELLHRFSQTRTGRERKEKM